MPMASLRAVHETYTSIECLLRKSSGTSGGSREQDGEYELHNLELLNGNGLERYVTGSI